MFNRLKSAEKLDITVILLLTFTVILTRFPFTSKFLYDWDSVNYALGFEKYIIQMDQPHAPGYIFFVGLGKLINTFFNDPNATMIFISVIFSIFTVILIYLLAKQMFSRKVAIVSSLLLIFSQTFWFYGEIASIYPSEAFFATLIAYLSYHAFKGNENYFYLSSLALGLAGGFRTDLIVFMFPLWAFCLFYGKFSYKRVIKAFSVLIPSSLMWFIPTIILAGGYHEYSLLNNMQLISSFKTSSVLFGAPLTAHLIMNAELIFWTIIGIGLIQILVVLIYLFLNVKNITSYFKNSKFIFFALWIVPSLLFYLIIYIAKAGYTLVYIPAMALIIGYIYVELFSDLKKHQGKISRYLLIIMVLFSITVSTYGFTGNAYGFSKVSNYNIKSSDSQTVSYFDAIKAINYNFSEENTSILMIDSIMFRKSMCYFPNYYIYIANDEHYTLAKNHSIIKLNQGKQIPINNNMETLVLITDRYFKDSNIEIKNVEFNNVTSYYFNIQNQSTNFEIDGIKFKRVNK